MNTTNYLRDILFYKNINRVLATHLSQYIIILVYLQYIPMYAHAVNVQKKYTSNTLLRVKSPSRVCKFHFEFQRKKIDEFKVEKKKECIHLLVRSNL